MCINDEKGKKVTSSQSGKIRNTKTYTHTNLTHGKENTVESKEFKVGKWHDNCIGCLVKTNGGEGKYLVIIREKEREVHTNTIGKH